MTYSKNVILGNGRFPTHSIPLEILRSAENLICCDGAVDSLFAHGIQPTAIIGDMDSISQKAKIHFRDIIHQDTAQDTNDQTKAVNWARSQGLTDVVILGATGLREDHSIGNISLLIDYAKHITVSMVSNHGEFTPIFGTSFFEAYGGQQVSIFSFTPQVAISSDGLRYPLHELQLQRWWMGTLNEAMGERFSLHFSAGEVIVFRAF